MKKNIDNDRLDLILNVENGSFDIISKLLKKKVIHNAFSTIKSKNKIYSTLSSKINYTQSPYDSNLGQGILTRVNFQKNQASDPVHFQLNIVSYPSLPFITLELIITNESKEELELSYISPLNINVEKNGGLFISDKPENAIVFENGLSWAVEFFLRSFNARQESDSVYMEYIYSKTDPWDNFQMGLISLPNYLGEIISNDEESKGLIIDGREAIAEWRAQLSFPIPKILLPNDSISSGVWLLRINADSGFDALESYADWIRIYNHLRVWPYEIPHGWNSWNNPIDGYREYSYVTQINEEIILKNMEIAVREFKNFGLHYWQLDSGYAGDLLVDHVDSQRFPHGMQYIADKIHEQGLKAGIWINPFNVGIKSDLYKEKAPLGWFPEPDPSFPIHQENWRSLDITIPEVQDHLRRFIRKVVT